MLASQTLRILTLSLVLTCAACADVVSPSNTGGTSGAGGCATNFDCEDNEYCFAASCGGLGSCEVRPNECPLNVAFVCGCDAKTYDNACEASKAGIRIASEGECVCNDNVDCDDLDYCEGESCDGPGTCETKPPSCPVIFDPVCGCDGNTYDSECVAEMQGVRIEATGPCPCTDNSTCLGTEYCAGNAGDTCEAPGTCELPPQFCDANFDPVCGCDGLEYMNDCVARSNSVRVEFKGACP